MVKAREKLVPQPVAPGPSLADPPAAASVIGISKRFGKTSVLENISFDVAEGEVLVLLGASGSGKTTILRIIAGWKCLMPEKSFLRQGRDGSSRARAWRRRHLPVVCTVSKDDGREKHRLRTSDPKAKAQGDPRNGQRAAQAGPTRRAPEKVSFATFRRAAAAWRLRDTRLQTRGAVV